ncbi:MAG: hypothetical protein RAO92_01035 [Candidatus Euphemobacter frigidus]|nr:hypothetical protein [Candidatus Euphemobacter frigidus]MDP8274963.1 hypothetical protein [Candidatus Euphemobacter frigidus]
MKHLKSYFTLFIPLILTSVILIITLFPAFSSDKPHDYLIIEGPSGGYPGKTLQFTIHYHDGDTGEELGTKSVEKTIPANATPGETVTFTFKMDRPEGK